MREALAKSHKDSIPAVKGGEGMKYNFTLRLEEAELEWLHQEAKNQNRSVGNLIREILEEYHQRETLPF